jgi:hypothetical protein
MFALGLSIGDVDRSLDRSQATIGDHVADVVDVAHARCATGMCITARSVALSHRSQPKDEDDNNRQRL